MYNAVAGPKTVRQVCTARSSVPVPVRQCTAVYSRSVRKVSAVRRVYSRSVRQGTVSVYSRSVRRCTTSVVHGLYGRCTVYGGVQRRCTAGCTEVYGRCTVGACSVEYGFALLILYYICRLVSGWLCCPVTGSPWPCRPGYHQ